MIHRLLTILFPAPCLVCGTLAQAICSECEKTFIFMPNMRRIKDLKIYSAHLYKKHEVIEQLISAFKYKQQKRIASIFGPRMVACLSLFAPSPHAILVPVPLHRKRELERGYNQSQLLAQFVGKRMGLEVLPLLKRQKNTLQQARLPRKTDREKNLRNAFIVQMNFDRDRQLILVDDIVTTGSTLLACYDCLVASGAQSISALTLANRDE